VKLPLVKNAFPQPGSGQAKGFSPVCVRICDVKAPLTANAIPQPGSGQTNGFSPVCVRRCVAKLPRVANAFLQPGSGQANGFSPVCVLRWITSAAGDSKALPQPGSVQASLFAGFFFFFSLRTLASFLRSLIAFFTPPSPSPSPFAEKASDENVGDLTEKEQVPVAHTACDMNVVDGNAAAKPRANSVVDVVIARNVVVVTEPKRSKRASLDDQRSISAMRERNVESMKFRSFDTPKDSNAVFRGTNLPLFLFDWLCDQII
jgi:hypothetical protein